MKTKDKILVTILIIVVAYLTGVYAVRYTNRQIAALREELTLNKPAVGTYEYWDQEFKKAYDQALIDEDKPENQAIENDELSADYENQIKDLRAEIKSLKAQLKKKK